jgi:hypothetical protein
MEKINKFHILIFYIAFSIALFFVLRLIMGSMIESNSSDSFTAMGIGFQFLPIFLISYTVILCILSLTGIFIYKRNNMLEIYRGFIYSLIYSLLLLGMGIGLILDLYSK